MKPEEISRLREIFRQKYDDLDRTPQEFWEKGSRERAWDELVESLGLKRLSKLVHLCAPPELDEIRIEEPNSDRYLVIPADTANKILVLGLP